MSKVGGKRKDTGLSVYALELENGKIYIGSSENVEERIKQHFNGEGSEWTRQHHPVNIMEIKHNCDSLAEDYTTKQYMKDYGLNNVRGGSYCQTVLTKSQRENLATEMKTADNKCFNCGQAGHFANKCISSSEEEEGESSPESQSEDPEEESSDEFSEEEEEEDYFDGYSD